MSDKNNNGAPTQTHPDLHLVCGSGGSRAILASAGVILACDHAGIKKWKSMGGVSGGSVPTALLAAGLTPQECVRQAIDVDFSSLLTRHGNILQILIAYFMQRRFEKTRPRKGVFSSEKVGAFIESISGGKWPERYWTLAVTADDSQYVFTDSAVYEITKDGAFKTLANKPGPLGAAVRASCAVPGIIDAVKIDGIWLHDGALGPEGRCPVGVPVRIYGAKRSQTVAMDVGDDTSKQSQRILKIWRILCGNECVPPDQPNLTEEGGLIVVTPTITNFRSLQFTLTGDQKWQAVMSGYMGAVPELEKAGLLTGKALDDAKAIIVEFNQILVDNEGAEDGVITRLTEALLAKYGVM